MVNRSMTSGGPVPRGDVRAQLELIGSTPTLIDAPRSLRADLVDLGRILRVRAGWTLLPEGTPPDKAYVLLDGQVAVRRARTDLHRCGPGEILGELGIVRRRLRSATVVSATDVTVLHIGRREFEWLYAEHRSFRDLVGEAMGRKTA